jgi:hypothetical protein
MDSLDTGGLGRLARTALLLLTPLLGSGCSEEATLAKDDTLIVAFEPGFLYAPTGDATPTTCSEAGGVVVRVIGIQADGQPAKGAQAVIWLGTGGVGSLASLNGLKPLATPYAFTLSDEDGTAQACLLANARGSLTVHARSGVVEASSTIDVRDRSVPPGGKVSLTVSPLTTGSQRPSTASICGSPAPDSCVPGQARYGAVSVHASTPESAPPLPESAQVVLSVDQGWLLKEGDCSGGEHSNQLLMTLDDGSGTAIWCVSDSGATATITAESGGVTASSQLTVPAIPAALQLGATQTVAAAGEAIGISAFVTGCDGAGVANQPVLFSVVSGVLQFATTNGIVRTAADGTATVSATVTTPPVVLGATLLGAPSLACNLDVGARQ